MSDTRNPRDVFSDISDLLHFIFFILFSIILQNTACINKARMLYLDLRFTNFSFVFTGK